jgi:hypothetical protein
VAFGARNAARFVVWRARRDLARGRTSRFRAFVQINLIR